MSDEVRITPEQLALRWGMSTGTLENWRSAGKGPRYIKLMEGRGGTIRYRLSDIVAYEDSHIFPPKGI